MFEFIFDLSLLVTGPAIVGSLCLFALGGLLFVRRRVLPRLRVQVQDSEFTGSLVQCVMVFYGLAVALIAVGVSETYSDVSKIVSQEATTLAALYRDVSCYPEPIRSQLQQELRDYADYVIHKAWPLQQRGQVPGGAVEIMDRFQTRLAGFEPSTEGQKLLHGETLRAYNQMIQARRLRLDAVNTGLPAVMWGGDCRGGVHRPECHLLFQGRGCALARNPGHAPGRLHRADHFHDPRPRPSVPGRSRNRPSTLSTHLRPTDETGSVTA